MATVLLITSILGGMISLLLLYRVVFTFIGFFWVKKWPEAKVDHEYAFMIAARNEANVVGQLISSILACDYDMSKVRIFVIADNCTDNTAEVARNAGATVFERFNKKLIGKGYALNYLMEKIHESEPDYNPEGFVIFDADNLLDKNWIKEMNKAFDAGEEVISSLRNGKNFDTNWISAVGCMSVMRDCRFMHGPRAYLGLCSNVTGTGWMVKNTILNFETGFPYHEICEDAQFTLDSLIKGHKLTYQDAAVFYDENPTKLKVVYKQRLRWHKGKYINLHLFAGTLFKKMFTSKKDKFSFYDQFVSIMPLDVISVLLLAFNVLYPIINGICLMVGGLAVGAGVWYIVQTLLILFASTYLGIFVYGVLMTIKDWKRMAASRKSKIVSMFMYPLFMIAIMPVPIIALFKRVRWVPIPHEDVRTIHDQNVILELSNKEDESVKKNSDKIKAVKS